MKTMNVTQQLNPEYMGQLNTPGIDQWIFKVTKVMDSVEPEIHARLTKRQIDSYCKREDWKVVIT